MIRVAGPLEAGERIRTIMVPEGDCTEMLPMVEMTRPVQRKEPPASGASSRNSPIGPPPPSTQFRQTRTRSMVRAFHRYQAREVGRTLAMARAALAFSAHRL